MIYFDNNATTQLTPNVFDAMRPFLQECYGNPSSAHQAGSKPRIAVERARGQVAAALGVTSSEITFVGTGSEANTQAIIGGMLSPMEPGKNLVISTVEHPSIREAAKFAANKFGFELREVPFETNGRTVRVEPFFERIDQNTKVISLMLANNETGVIMPVAEVFQFARQWSNLRHCDAAQGLGKMRVRVQDLNCNAMTLAPHKFHGPKGIGVFYLQRGIKLDPLILGGPQEYGRRAGTEDVAGIVGVGEAAASIGPEIYETLAALRDYFEQELTKAVGDRIAVNFKNLPRIPNTSSVQFVGQDANVLLIKLDKEGVCVSAGSACSSGSLSVSKILLASGLNEKEAAGTLRISFSKLNTRPEIDQGIAAMARILSP